MSEYIPNKPQNRQPEFALQVQICSYLRLQYPKVLFLTDAVSAITLTMPQSIRNKKVQNENFHTPDLIIFKKSGNYGAFFLELKAKSIYKQNSTELLKNDHVEKQIETCKELQKLGYFSAFAWTFESAKELIDEYLAS